MGCDILIPALKGGYLAHQDSSVVSIKRSSNPEMLHRPRSMKRVLFEGGCFIKDVLNVFPANVALLRYFPLMNTFGMFFDRSSNMMPRRATSSAVLWMRTHAAGACSSS